MMLHSAVYSLDFTTRFVCIALPYRVSYHIAEDEEGLGYNIEIIITNLIRRPMRCGLNVRVQCLFIYNRNKYCVHALGLH